MNCKPGDLAYIVAKNPRINRRYVTVLHQAPIGLDFQLPDGVMHDACDAKEGAWWVCEFCTPIEAPMNFASSAAIRVTRYAPVPDVRLRPIRDPGDDAKDEMLRPLPEEVPA